MHSPTPFAVRRDSSQTQTRDHLFKVCPERKAQQKILWEEVQEESGRGKSRFKFRDLLADGRCSQAALDFLSTTDVGRLDPAEEDAGSEVSEQERREREEERRGGRRRSLYSPLVFP